MGEFGETATIPYDSGMRRYLQTLSASRPMLSSTDTDVGIDTATRPSVGDTGDHDKFAHYVRKSDIPESAVTGTAIVALCGKKWVPTRLPDDFPVCPDCKKIYEQLKPSA